LIQDEVGFASELAIRMTLRSCSFSSPRPNSWIRKACEKYSNSVTAHSIDSRDHCGAMVVEGAQILRLDIAGSREILSRSRLTSRAHFKPMQPHSAETQSQSGSEVADGSDLINLREILRSLQRGLSQTLGLGLLGLFVGAVVFLSTFSFRPIATSTRVVFSFDGFEQGEYPDHSKFQPDDMRSPEIIAEALRRQGFAANDELQVKVRAALTIEGIIPVEIVRERDRLRAAGQVPARFIPDEYAVVLTLPRKFPIGIHQRELLLHEIVSAFQENFVRTYESPPLEFGNVFESLRKADFFEYELVLNEEMGSIEAYLTQQLEKSKSFRSQTTNLSFADLLSQTRLFVQIHLNETMGRIIQNGLSKDRHTAIVKMDYYLQNLADEEARAVEEDAVVKELLAQEQTRTQSYVLGTKSQISQPHSETPILDQGLIDTLLANDTYNMLVRRALEAGMRVKQIQADKARLLERRKAMEAFNRGDVGDQAQIIAQVQSSLADLEHSYLDLVANIRSTNADFVRQQFGGAVRQSDQVRTEGGIAGPLALCAVLGCFLGIILGMSLSLLNVYTGKQKSPPIGS
jgi:hypothetical protein